MERLIRTLVERVKTDNPAQAAIWAAWDEFSGVEKVREFRSFQGLAMSVASDLSVDGEYGSRAQKAGDTEEGKLRTIERGSRKWRTAYNMWREGKDIDLERLAKDMTQTKNLIGNTTTRLLRHRRSGVESDFNELEGQSAKTVAAFDKAIRAVRAHAD